MLTFFFNEHFGLATALMSPLGKVLDPFVTTVNASMDYVMSFVVARIVKGKNWMNEEKEQLNP